MQIALAPLQVLLLVVLLLLLRVVLRVLLLLQEVCLRSHWQQGQQSS
jgi:hypothetical protein